MNGKDIIRFGKKYSPLILSGIGIGSSVAATVLAAKAEKSISPNATRKEKALAYKWAILAEVVSVAALTASTGISWRRAKKLTEIAAANTGRAAKLIGTVTAGVGADKIAKACERKDGEVKNEKELWYDLDMDWFFETTEKDVLWAMYYSLGYFTEHGELKIENLYKSMKAECPPHCNGIGWYADDEFFIDWELATLPFYYDPEPIVGEDGRTYRRFSCECPPKFYEELYYE